MRSKASRDSPASRQLSQASQIGRTLPDGVIHIAPPFVVTEDDLAMLARVIAEALDDEAGAT